HFRSKANASIIIRCKLQMPSGNFATDKMERLIIRFKTSDRGPSLRTIELLSGSARLFNINTNLVGDYTTRQSEKPASIANVWVWNDPVKVSAQNVLRLHVNFPGGFEGIKDAGEFILSSVEVHFVAKAKDFTEKELKSRVIISSGAANKPVTTPPKPPGTVTGSKGVIYLVSKTNQLLWYNHTGREDGSFNWETSESKIVGTGWNFKEIFSGGDNVLYTISADGELTWYRHDGRNDGTFRWTGPKPVASDWNYKNVFYGGDGVIYTITTDGQLFWNRHEGRNDGSPDWSGPEPVGNGWNFKNVFCGDNGVIYAITPEGELSWYRHDGHNDGSFKWTGPTKIGTGWNFKEVFYGGDGVIYAIKADGQLLWYRHEGRNDGSNQWSGPRIIGTGWDSKQIFSH
ncbi:MAG: tachylectin-related carbohydrate-binding protein, partial [Ferruginibacter sp.]